MYREGGMTSEFILMTVGDFRENSKTPMAATGSRSGPSKGNPRKALEATASRNDSTSSSPMAPPSRRTASNIVRDNTRSRVSRPSPPPPQPSIESNSLFLPETEDDRSWDPVGDNYEDEEMLGWDAGADNVCPTSKIVLCFDLIDLIGREPHDPQSWTSRL